MIDSSTNEPLQNGTSMAPKGSQTPSSIDGLPDGPSIYTEGAMSAFAQHLGAVALVDLTNVEDPFQQWLTTLRQVMGSYGHGGIMPSLEGVDFSDVNANGVPGLLVQTPDADQNKRVLYIHGGGWVGGSPHGYRFLAATLARASKAVIFVPDYRLAPEHPFPSGLEDCVKSFQWLSEDAFFGPAERTSMVGDSAGGNLSAAATLSLLASDELGPDRLVLIAGTLDNVERSERVKVDDPICPAIAFKMCNLAYVDDPTKLEDPFVSPVYASRHLLSKFPPTLLQVSAAESLVHDSVKFSNRLIDAGVQTKLNVWPGLPHVWHAFLGLIPEAEEAIREIAEFLDA